MKSSFMIYPFKFCISAVTSLFSFILAVSMLLIARPGSFLLFLVIAVVFLAVALINGSKLTIDEKGVRRTLFGRILQQYSWEDITEVGIVGTKVFGNDDKKDVGSRHLYFPERSCQTKNALGWCCNGLPMISSTCSIIQKGLLASKAIGVA